jgi:hypothetical protein
MRLVLGIVALLLIREQVHCAEVCLYAIDEAGHAVRPLKDGRIQSAVLVSRANDNSRFQLSLVRREPFSLPAQWIGLIAGTNVMRTVGSSSENHNYSIEFLVENTNLVASIAQYFGASVRPRHHPGHQILVSFVPERQEYASGQPIKLKLRIVNIGPVEFTFHHIPEQIGLRDESFAFSSMQNGVQSLPRLAGRYSVMLVRTTLKPGENWEVPVDLAKWFAFDTEGAFTFRGSYRLNICDSDFFIVWEGFACAEFTVNIKVPEPKRGLLPGKVSNGAPVMLK